MLDKKNKGLIEGNVIVIYDGMCGFCDSSIQFILENGPSDRLRFVSFQSDMGQKIIANFNVKATLDSIIVIEDNKYYKKSRAIFKILKYVNSSLSYLKYFNFIPSKISDFCYDIIAKNRYKLMAQKCRLLTEEERGFFI